MTKIARNKAKCLICGDVIESKYRHDYVTCSCGNLSVDGGTDYLKRSCKEMDKWEDQSEMKNGLKELFDLRSINVKAFAEKNDIPPYALYAMLREGAKLEKIGIGIFKKIADGLDFELIELYEILFQED